MPVPVPVPLPLPVPPPLLLSLRPCVYGVERGGACQDFMLHLMAEYMLDGENPLAARVTDCYDPLRRAHKLSYAAWSDLSVRRADTKEHLIIRARSARWVLRLAAACLLSHLLPFRRLAPQS